MPKHYAPGHGPGHHGPRHHRWIFAHHDEAMSPTDYAAVLRDIADALDKGDGIELNGIGITVGPSLEFELIHEQTPHGALAIVIRAEWAEQGPAVAAQSGVLAIASIRAEG